MPDWLLFPLWGLLALSGAWAAVRVWRGQGDDVMSARELATSKALWHGTRRAVPVLAASGVVLVIALTLRPALPEDAVRVLVVAALLAGLALYLSIVLVNQPKPLVPPPLRGEPGALRWWLSGPDPEWSRAQHSVQVVPVLPRADEPQREGFWFAECSCGWMSDESPSEARARFDARAHVEDAG